MDVGIVGVMASGKTTVFNALTGGHGSTRAGAEHIGAVKIPDDRLDRLGALVRAKKITPIEVTLHDLPPLFERGAAPSGDAAETLSRTDALLHVVRAFEREDVPHPKGSVDLARDIKAFDEEMAFNDLGIIERRLEKLDITVRSARPVRAARSRARHRRAETPVRADRASRPPSATRRRRPDARSGR